MLFLEGALSAQQQPGSVRGVVRDRDFDMPLAGALVTLVETGQTATTADLGNYVFPTVAPGKYTLVFTKDGYIRQVKADVDVAAGQLVSVDVALAGEFTDLDEFLVQDILAGGSGTEAALLRLRFDSAALMDSIGTDMMSRAGASDAAAGLRLVSGASLQNGKSAVIRGLPDRYVSSQMNGVRLPSADEDKRAVDLDQFPAVVLDSLQVSKTFTPDQQGDASGGAVNVKLKAIPDDTVLQVSGQLSENTNVAGSDFLSYKGGGIQQWGDPESAHKIQPIGENWKGAVGVSTTSPPQDYKWSATAGDRWELGSGLTLGGLASFFYERDSTYFNDGKNDSLWVTTPGGKLVPQTSQGAPSQGTFKTSLLDVTQGSQIEKWGGLGTIGIASDKSEIDLTYLATKVTEDTATLAQDTRGKAYFFPGYDPNDPSDPGNQPVNLDAAPYTRTETLNYTQRKTSMLQLDGTHQLGDDGPGAGTFLGFGAPELEWSVSHSTAELDQPDKRQFGSLWKPSSYNPGFPPFIPPFTTPPTWYPYLPAENINLGNEQRIFKNIQEDADEYSLNAQFPFHWWGERDGYMKMGWYDDSVDRTFKQETFSNIGDFGATFLGDFDQFWSSVFPAENHPITASLQDNDYDGTLDVSAWYQMWDVPLDPELTLIGGARYETTSITVINHPEAETTWFPPGSVLGVHLNPGDADVDFNQDDLLPSVGLVYQPTQEVTVRGNYSETVARQTFKELTPVIQQEFLGGPIFIGNPELGMSSLKNYDLRVDYVPYEGGLLSVSAFEKKIEDPIEYVQKVIDFSYTTAVNYPKGKLDGFELEARQNLGQLWKSAEGVAVGANATFINSTVDLPQDEIDDFAELEVNMTSRDMTNAPDHLYNLYATWDLPNQTQLAVFYTITGDTLIAGAGEKDGNFIPSVFAKEYGTLNLTLSHTFGEQTTVQFQAKNLTDPEIETFYDSSHGDVTKTSFTRGREYSLGVTVRF